MKRLKTETFILIALIFFFSCKHQNKPTTVQDIDSYQPVDTLYYKNLITGEVIKDSDMHNYVDSLSKEFSDSIFGQGNITVRIKNVIEKKDSAIKCFTYDIRVGLDYPVRSREYTKIGMTIPATKLKTINGDSIQIGGIQDKPTVINLWFIECRGCVAEIPALNRLHEKYEDKVNFIALTFDNENEVRNFLNKKPYNFTHIASKDRIDHIENIKPFIKTIESYPYPENIFIDRKGTIKYIEGGLSNMEDLDIAIQHFELIIQDLLSSKTD